MSYKQDTNWQVKIMEEKLLQMEERIKRLERQVEVLHQEYLRREVYDIK